MQADSGAGFLVTEDSYADFELSLEFWVNEPANSGIFVRCADPASVTDTNSYEVNIYDTRADQTYRTGRNRTHSLTNERDRCGRAPGIPTKLQPRAHGSWSHSTALGWWDVEDTQYADGPIALQYGAGIVKFRNVRIRPL